MDDSAKKKAYIQETMIIAGTGKDKGIKGGLPQEYISYKFIYLNFDCLPKKLMK